MSILTDPRNPLPAVGMSSLVLGYIALLLFVLPVLGIPISLFGLLFGVIGLVIAWRSGWDSLRWSLAGIGLSLLALGVNVAIQTAPEGFRPSPHVPRPWQPVYDRPYIPPPG